MKTLNIKGIGEGIITKLYDNSYDTLQKIINISKQELLNIEGFKEKSANNLIESLKLISIEWKDIPMLARTHGQAASPTLLGKEIFVFVNRIEKQLSHLKAISLTAKFGGATGNMNAHYVSYPEVDWKIFATNFVVSKLNLSHSYPTTQIDHYDELANYFDCVKRINTILIDFCRDIWTYISIDYFKQKLKASEVGSSAMPHKVNPIDFENAEGNLGLANALFEHLSSKLPISRFEKYWSSFSSYCTCNSIYR